MYPMTRWGWGRPFKKLLKKLFSGLCSVSDKVESGMRDAWP